MKYNVLLLAGVLPIIAAQSGVSGAAKPTGFAPGGTVKWSNSTNIAGATGFIKSSTPTEPVPISSANLSNKFGMNPKTSTEDGTKTESTNGGVSANTVSHVPYAPGTGAHFANATGSPFDNVHVYPTGTGASSGLAKPTNPPQVPAVGTGNLPNTSGASFINATANSSGGANGNSVLPTGTGVSTSYAEPSAISNSTSTVSTTIGHQPYTTSKGLQFGNSTSSGVAFSTEDSNTKIASATGILPTGPPSSFPIQTASGRPPFATTQVATASNKTSNPTGYLTGVTVPTSEATKNAASSAKPLWSNSTSISKTPASSIIPGTSVAPFPTTISSKLNETSFTIVSTSASGLPTFSAIPPYSNSTVSAPTRSISPTTFGTVTILSTTISAPTGIPIAEF